ncbi:MAG TPA: cytochrome c [Mucilaginibacter sp.]|nr:cytochrome c [Mucilaginibacter sp.]
MKLRIIGAISAVIILFIVSCESEESLEFKRYYSTGAVVYQTHCQNCHGAKGEGLSDLMPPLTDTAYLKNNKTALACLVKFGLKGKITINSKTYDDTMPVVELTNMEIAQVLTYIGNSFGNKLNTIDFQQVENDLGKCNQ